MASTQSVSALLRSQLLPSRVLSLRRRIPIGKESGPDLRWVQVPDLLNSGGNLPQLFKFGVYPILKATPKSG